MINSDIFTYVVALPLGRELLFEHVWLWIFTGVVEYTICGYWCMRTSLSAFIEALRVPALLSLELFAPTVYLPYLLVMSRFGAWGMGHGE